MCQWGIVMLKSGGFFAEKDIILHIQSPVYLFIYLFTFCNHGCFQTSYKCIKAGGSIQGKCTIFFFFFLGFYSTTAPEGKKGFQGKWYSRGLSEGCLHAYPLFSFAEIPGHPCINGICQQVNDAGAGENIQTASQAHAQTGWISRQRILKG